MKLHSRPAKDPVLAQGVEVGAEDLLQCRIQLKGYFDPIPKLELDALVQRGPLPLPDL